jgi:cytochrome P450
MVRIGAKNLLGIWEDKAFDYQLMTLRLLGRKVFICNSPDTVRHAFVAHHDSFERKSPQMRRALAPLLGDGLLISDGEVWRSRRRLVASIVHASRMAEFAPIMAETIGEVQDRWAALPDGTEIDALDEMATCTAEVICRTIFGRTLGREHARKIVDSFTAYQEGAGGAMLLSLIGLPDWIPLPGDAAARRSVGPILAVLDEIVASYRARQAAGDGEAAMIGHLIEARDETTGEPLTAEVIRNEAAVIFLAGHETTASTIAWVWHLLSGAPDVEAKLHEELDRILGGRKPELADLPRLTYLRAVIDETLRLYPPIPFLAREAVKEDAIRRRPTRPGSLVVAVPWLLHRHRQLWDDPDSFRPERFLPEAPRKPERYAYIPFSAGPRVCPGLAFGITESMLCVASLAQRFSLRMRPGAKTEAVCRLTLRPGGDGLPMTVHRRVPVAAAAPVPANDHCPFGHG